MCYKSFSGRHKKGDKTKQATPQQKKLEKPLDKIPNLWYNKYVIKRKPLLKI